MGDACPLQALRELLHLNGHNVQVRARGTLGESLAACARSVGYRSHAASEPPPLSPERAAAVPGAGARRPLLRLL